MFFNYARKDNKKHAKHVDNNKNDFRFSYLHTHSAQARPSDFKDARLDLLFCSQLLENMECIGNQGYQYNEFLFKKISEWNFERFNTDEQLCNAYNFINWKFFFS